jgi:hypothetical protein
VSIVNRNADLIYRTYLEITLPDTTAAATGSTRDVNWTPGAMRRLGFLMLEKIEVEIGGQIIDRHYGEWWYLLGVPDPARRPVAQGRSDAGRLPGRRHEHADGCNGRPSVLYIPFGFWFNRNPGLALPLIALQYHDVHFNVWFRKATDLVTTYSGIGGNWPNIAAAAAALPPPKEAAILPLTTSLSWTRMSATASPGLARGILIERLQYPTCQQTITSAPARPGPRAQPPHSRS